MTQTTIPDRLKELRERCKLSGRELGRLAGLSEGSVHKVETAGNGNYELKTLGAFARVLGSSLDYLVNGEGDPPTDEQLNAAVAAARAALAPSEDSNPNGGAAA